MLRKPGLAGLLDPSNYQGVRLWVRGNGERYSVHLRTCRTWLPWQFFYTTFDTSDQWRQVDLPFGEFKSESFTLGAKLRPSRL